MLRTGCLRRQTALHDNFMFLRNYANGWICLAPETLRLCKTANLYQSVNYASGAELGPAKPSRTESSQAIGHLIYCQKQMPSIYPSISSHPHSWLPGSHVSA